MRPLRPSTRHYVRRSGRGERATADSVTQDGSSELILLAASGDRSNQGSQKGPAVPGGARTEDASELPAFDRTSPPLPCSAQWAKDSTYRQRSAASNGAAQAGLGAMNRLEAIYWSATNVVVHIFRSCHEKESIMAQPTTKSAPAQSVGSRYDHQPFPSHLARHDRRAGPPKMAATRMSGR